MFEFRTRSPIEIVAQRLQAIHQPARSILQSWCKRAICTPRHDGGFDFEICAQEHKWSGDHTVLQANGVLNIDPVTSETVISGQWNPTFRQYIINTIKGLVIFLSAIAVLVLIFVEDIEQRTRMLLGFGLIASLVCAWLFYEYWRNRRGLARALKATTEHPASDEEA